MLKNVEYTGIIDCNVEITEMMGATTYLYLECEGIPLTAMVDPRSTARPGDQIKVALDPNKIHLFDKETEKTIVNCFCNANPRLSGKAGGFLRT